MKIQENFNIFIHYLHTHTFSTLYLNHHLNLNLYFFDFISISCFKCCECIFNLLNLTLKRKKITHTLIHTINMNYNIHFFKFFSFFLSIFSTCFHSRWLMFEFLFICLRTKHFTLTEYYCENLRFVCEHWIRIECSLQIQILKRKQQKIAFLLSSFFFHNFDWLNVGCKIKENSIKRFIVY